MSVSISVMNSLVYVSTLLKNQRLWVNNQEPGLSMANMTLQRLLNPPFVWRFNRKTFSIPITLMGGTDYTVTLDDLSRIETQWLTNSTGAIFELKGAVELPKVSSQRRPQRVAPVYDDNEGNLTFRFDVIPDAAYTAWFDYQAKAPVITSFANTFGPVPDEFSYLFNKWMLAEGALLINDGRAATYQRDAVAGTLATQDGLNDQDKAIFYEQMMGTGRWNNRNQSLGTSGASGRGVTG